MKIKCVLVMSGNSVCVYYKAADCTNQNKETLFEIGNNYDAYSEKRKTQKGPFPVPVLPSISYGNQKFSGIMIDKSKLNDFKNDATVKSLLNIVDEISTTSLTKAAVIPVAKKDAKKDAEKKAKKKPSLADQLAEKLL